MISGDIKDNCDFKKIDSSICTFRSRTNLDVIVHSLRICIHVQVDRCFTFFEIYFSY